jgi:hypothetical protein
VAVGEGLAQASPETGSNGKLIQAWEGAERPTSLQLQEERSNSFIGIKGYRQNMTRFIFQMLLLGKS